MIEREKLVKAAYRVAYLSIFLDVISTYMVLKTRSDVIEVSGGTDWLILTMGLTPALLFMAGLSVILTLLVYWLYKRGYDDGIMTWAISLYRMYLVLGNFILFFKLPHLPIGSFDNLIVIFFLMLIFQILT